MARANRNRKLPLSEAWQHYWSELFSGGGDWRADLESEIRNRLYFPGDSSEIFSGDNLNKKSPQWVGKLEIGIQDNSVNIRFQGTEFGCIRLFGHHLIPALNNFKKKSPLVRLGGATKMIDLDRTECRDFFIAVVRKCGNAIQNRLLGILKEAEQPKFEIFCQPNDDPFSKERRLPVSGLSYFVGVDIDANALTDRMRLSKFYNVQIKKRTPSNSKAGPRGTFEEQDAVLVEKMQKLIDEGKASTVRPAALLLVREAPRRKGASDESVLRRLEKRFSERYPNDSNRRGHKATSSP